MRSNFINKEHDISQKLSDYYIKNPYEGKKYYGVTRVLSETKSEADKASLERWRERIGHDAADAILQESLKIGNSLDEMLEKYLNKELGNILDYKEEPGAKLFLQIRSHIDKLDPVGTQIHLYDDEWKIQGFLDCIAIVKNKDVYQLTMIDFKNSLKKKDPSYIKDYYLQATIYCLLLYRMTGILINDIKIMIAVRDGFTVQIFNSKIKEHMNEAIERINVYRLIHASK